MTTLRGTVVEVGEPRTVSTAHGESDLAEITLRPDPARCDGVSTDDSLRVTLWGKWTETAAVLEPGMELLVTDPGEREFRGEIQYSTTGDSSVVVEPGYLVNVTAIRSWVECPRLYYLNKLSGIPLNYPVLKGTIVHEVFGDLLRGRPLEESIDDRIDERGLELGLLGRDPLEVAAEVRQNASAIEGWLAQGTLGDRDSWRSEQTLISETFGIKGRADAIRRGMPVELKTGKNLRKEARFKDKVQAAAYALLLEERGESVDTGTLLYTKNSALERSEETGDLSPAKEFSIGPGLLKYVLRVRNAIAAAEWTGEPPTGYEAEAKCEYCFEQDTCMVVSGRLAQESKAGQIGRAVPSEEREYFDRMYRAIETERRAAHREYTKLWEQTAEERADDDRALIDLEFVGKRPLDDGGWELRVRQTGDAVSKLREGDVVLASDGHPIRGHAEVARIERMGGPEPRSARGSSGDDTSDDERSTDDPREIVLTAEEPVQVTRLDVYPSELSADRMLTAVHDAILKGDPRRKDVLFGRAEPAFDELDELDEFQDRDPEPFVDNNDAQNEAVTKAVTARDCALIHGPPGTGKTYTIARAIRAMVERGERVLLSAFTNRAVDNALEALVDQGFTDFVRVGTESGVREDMQEYRLRRRGDPSVRERTLREARVVAATTATCGSRVMGEQRFDVALVDEAGQLTEPGALAAINLADRFVLVGDHQQLPPVVRTDAPEAGEERADLGRSLFERLIETYPEAGVMLDRQYRMNQRIQAFPSSEFYDGQLRPATAEVAGRTLDDLSGVSRSALPDHLRDPVTFLHVEGDDGRHTDAVEAETVAAVIDAFADAGISRRAVGVIAPFRAQVAEIARRVPDDVAVDTVDRFQGSSEEVIVVSFVATDELDGPIFEDYRRVNVALTRAKRALVLVGDETALRSDPVYARMVEWAR